MKVGSLVKHTLPHKVSNWKTIHLPVSAFAKWRKAFISTFAAYIGTKHSPWNLKDKKTLDTMQDCWDHVYQSNPITRHRISGVHDIVFVLVGILALVKYTLMGPIGQSTMERTTKHYWHHCHAGPQGALHIDQGCD